MPDKTGVQSIDICEVMGFFGKVSIHQQLQSVAQRVESMYWLYFIGAQRHYL